MPEIKLVRITTVPISLNLLLRGQLQFMRENGMAVYTASADGPEIKEMTEREGVPHRMVHMTRKITPFSDSRAVYAMYRWFKELKPDIVHTHTPKAGIVGMLAARLAGVPHRLHTVAGMPLMETSGIKRKILETVEELTYSCATQVYPNSMNLKSFILENLSVRADKVSVIGQGSSNGIDTEFFSNTEEIREQGKKIRQELGIHPDDIVFGFVGRIVKDKGINELVAAFNEIHIHDPRSQLVLVGPFEDDLDPVSSETRELIRAHVHIHTVGFQSDIRPFLSAMDIFTFPSYREGFPNVVLQAACFELPMIVTDINGCNEIVENGVNGSIIPPKNENDLQAAMVKLKDSVDLREKLGIMARRKVEENYSQQYIWEQLLAEYNRLCTET